MSIATAVYLSSGLSEDMACSITFATSSGGDAAFFNIDSNLFSTFCISEEYGDFGSKPFSLKHSNS